MSHELINLALALSAGELTHNSIESQTVREKVKRLRAYKENRPYKELPININTRAKSYGISLVGLVLFTAIFYLLFSILNLSTTRALQTIIVILVVAYAVTAIILDKYHVEIEVVTKPYRRIKK